MEVAGGLFYYTISHTTVKTNFSKGRVMIRSEARIIGSFFSIDNSSRAKLREYHYMCATQH